MAKITRLSSEQRENLVAYLDGELEEPAAKEIEQVLASSPVARHDVDMLSRTWDLLGVLPQESASEDFTARTLTSIRAIELPKFKVDDQAVSRFSRRVLGLILGSCILVGGGIAGYLATAQWVPNETDEILDDFEIIDNLDKFLEAGNVEYIQSLKELREFSEGDDAAP